jgi:hypothetical protein
MVVKRQGAPRPAVLPCTRIANDRAFEMGAAHTGAAKADRGMVTPRGAKRRQPLRSKTLTCVGAARSAV